MKKKLLAIALCLSPPLALAAQTPVTNIGAFAYPAYVIPGAGAVSVEGKIGVTN